MTEEPVSSPLFVHSSIDDAGLSTGAFRVLCHLARRAGRKDAAFPSIRAIAKKCRMNCHTVIEAIRELEQIDLVVAERKPGRHTVYRLFPKRKLGSKTTPVDTVSVAYLGNSRQPNGVARLGNAVLPTQATECCLTISAHQVPEPLEVPEGTPYKEIHIRGSIIKSAKAQKKYPPLDDFIFREDGEEEEGGNEGKEASELRSADNAAQHSSSVTNSKHSKAGARTKRSRPANPKPGSAVTVMPSLEQIRVETQALDLPDTDADQLHDYWLSNGFQTGQNQVHDWKAVIRCWHRGKRFPSQKPKFETFEHMRARARKEEDLAEMKRLAARQRDGK